MQVYLSLHVVESILKIGFLADFRVFRRAPTMGSPLMIKDFKVLLKKKNEEKDCVKC